MKEKKDLPPIEVPLDDIQPELIITADGSHSLLLPQWKEHYHSKHGAVQESIHVFIREGFDEVSGKVSCIRLLEVGLGTGLNVFLTFLEHLRTGNAVDYTVLETHPLKEELALQLNYPELLKSAEHQEVFNNIHRSPWSEWVNLGPKFRLRKLSTLVQNYLEEGAQYDLVYYDAFAPTKQPELWTPEVFANMEKMMVPGAVLVTYCAKSDVRRAMQSAGLTVEKRPGPPGKREMLRARKNE